MDLLKAVSSAVNKGSAALDIEDVFSTYVYTGTGAAQSIVNGIDLATEGGMVWTKRRSTTRNHNLFDTERGVTHALITNGTFAENADASAVTAYNTDGYVLGVSTNVTALNETYASWTFRKAPRFFDVVKYTGNGVAGREIAHDLGVAPGMIIVKSTSHTSNWQVYHKDLSLDGGTGDPYGLMLNSTNPEYYNITWGNGPSETAFEVGTSDVNELDKEYVAYLFADDPDGPSGDGSDGLIACGSFTGNGSTDGPEIDLGWEPQYILIKASTIVENWYIFDTMRGLVVSNSVTWLEVNSSNSEVNAAATYINTTADGFNISTATDELNKSGETYIYMAIRRPMRTPESSDEVFAISERLAQLPAYEAGFVVDMAIRRRYDVATNNRCYARLIGTNFVETDTTDIQSNDADAANDYMTGYDNTNIASSVNLAWMFKRAAGFFDVVAYTGDGVAGRTVDHNLGVVPEMMIIKRRDATGNWMVLINLVGSSSDDGVLENTNSFNTRSYPNTFLNAAPSKSIIYLGDNPDVNASSTSTHIAYLFATLPSISKVGSYIGNGTLQTIDCGFAAGAKFVLIKRTDSTGDWWFYDSVRGIVAGNDPALKLNDTAAEVTTADCIDPDTNGFIVNQEATCNLNVNLGEYIFYAISI